LTVQEYNAFRVASQRVTTPLPHAARLTCTAAPEPRTRPAGLTHWL